MALISKRIDDLDGKTLVEESTKFALHGVNYSIDLGPENLAKFEELLEPYIEAATQTYLSAVPSRQQDTDTQAIREWANAHGYKVADRGRIAQNIQDAYKAAMEKTAETAETTETA